MKRLLMFCGVIALMLGVKAAAREKLQTVPYVDINKYMGKWHEIASFPQRFQKGCSCTVAEYSLKPNGKVSVKNSCTAEGKLKKSTGTATVKDKKTNAKLAVRFFWPFTGKYWIIDLADDYSYAVVGHPNRKYLWILSRKPAMDPDVYTGIVERAKAKGFDITKLKVTKQCP
ncbi:MAG TPA: lipocalin family protein [Flavipsychrobacter sp.]